MNKITIGEVSIAPTRMSRIGDGLIVLGLRFPDDAGFPVALVPTQRQDIATAQSCIRSKLDDRSQVPTNIFGGVKKPPVFVGTEIPDNLIIRTEHPNLTNRILVKDPLNIAPVEEGVKDTEILSTVASLTCFTRLSLNFSTAAVLILASGVSRPNSCSMALSEVSVYVRNERLCALQYSRYSSNA